MESFNGRLKSLIAKKKSCLCIGLDMDPKLLNTTKLEKLRDHSRLVIDATIDLAIAFKPNFAFFERWGSAGFSWLEEIVEYIGDDLITIADAKRGDIGNTALQYAHSVFSHFCFDSVTLNPYMGSDSIKPFLDYPGKGVFILCKTSNASSIQFQNLNLNKKLLYEKVVEMALDSNKNKNVGLVVGATAQEELKAIRKLAPELPLLIPGVGAQGGDLFKSVKTGNKNGAALISVSRGISFAGDLSKKAIRQEAKKYVEKMAEVLNG